MLTGHRLAIVAHGTPIPQGSKVANRFGGGVRDANASKLKPWRTTVRDAALDAARYYGTYTGPVKVWINFTFDRPASHRRTGRNAALLRDDAPLFPCSRNDLDKLQRAILDALTDAHVWTDDGLVVDVRARKVYAGEHEHALPRPGVTVIVEQVT